MKITLFCWCGAAAAGYFHWWLLMVALLWLGVAACQTANRYARTID